MDLSLVRKARNFARWAHMGQCRDGGDPYFFHLERVAAMVTALPGAGSDHIAAAFLHDTLEDTHTKFDTLIREFGEEVAALVVELTNLFTKEEYPSKNRAERMRMEHNRLAKVSTWAKRLKACDRLDNLVDMPAGCKLDFVQLYAEESLDLKRALLENCGDLVLRDILGQLSTVAMRLRG